MTDKLYAGIDVSKDSLDCDYGKDESFENSVEGIRHLVKQFKAAGVTLVVVESTGGYERSVVAALCAAHVPVAVMNPRRTHSFARSLGVEAKTDKIDARILRLFGERMNPVPRKLPPEKVEKLQFLLDRRLQLVDMIVAEKNHLKAPLGCPETKKSITSILKALTKELKAIESRAAAIIEANADLKLIADTVQQEKGVGPVLTLSLLADLPEIGTINRAQVSALLGVAPFDDQSGNSDGRRSIKGGRQRLRQTLYMATVCAIRRNQKLKDFFLALVKRGKHKMVALVATMRKFIIRLNSLVRKLREENPSMAFAFS